MDAPPLLHPTDQTLSGYGLGKLDDSSAAAVSKHLEECRACRRRVAEMTSDSFLSRLRDAQPPPDNPPLNRARSEQSRAERGRGEPADPSSQPAADTLPSGLADHPDYEVLRELGRGGMGVVYLAHNRLMGRHEVLKVVGRHVLERPGVLDRFLREIRAVAKLRHINIVTAYSAFRIGESIVFAMEYVEGLDLARMVKAKGPLPVAHACSFGHQAALGLQHAHEQGMVHRDIKPGNLMLSRREGRAVVQILDFGLAKVAREDPLDGGLTHEGQMLGTPDFIAPEQTIDAQKADIRADIYSLGCTLYYLLTGGPPFRGTSLYDVLQAHHSMDARPVNLVRPEVQVELAAVIARMMAKEPARRYQTPGEVAQALAPFFKKGGIGSKDPRAELSKVGPPSALETSAGAFSLPTQPETTPKPAAAQVVKTAAGNPPRESTIESLIDIREAERPAKPSEVVGPTRRPPWVWPSVAVGVLLLGLLVAWAAGVFKIKTKDGVILLENVPEQAEVFVDGEKITLHWPKAGAPLEITVPAGKRGVQVKKDGFITFGQEVIVEAGGNKDIRVALIPLADSSIVEGDGRATSKPAERPRSPSPTERASETALSLPAYPFGYVVHDSPNVVNDIAPYTNIVLDRGWSRNGDALVNAARQRRLPVVVLFFRSERPAIEETIIPFIRKHRDVVVGVGWDTPYGTPFPGQYTPADVSEFGRLMKGTFPGLEYWVSFTAKPGGKEDALPIPAEVDRILVTEYYASSPEMVRKQVNDVMPSWLKKAAGRPVLLRWVSRMMTDSIDETLHCGPGTLLACRELAKKYHLQGLIFDQYGLRRDRWSPGIDTDPPLVEEIKGIAGELGLLARGDGGSVTSDAGRSRSRAPSINPPQPPAGVQPAPEVRRSQSIGENLAGWNVMKNLDGTDTLHQPGFGGWTARGGTIVCDTREPGWLRSDRQYGDFVLKLEFKIPKGGNSGVYIRCPEQGHPSSAGMEIQIVDYNDDIERKKRTDLMSKSRAGSIWGVVAAKKLASLPTGQWNALEIRCVRDRVAVKLNGINVVAADMSRFEALKHRPRRGYVGLSNWNGEAYGTSFRNIRIEELDN